MIKDLVGYRVLAVHAHPDDESITTGAALADFARRGADVAVVTCTLGEEGEVIGERYQQLVAAEADQLGGFRISELRAALEILGVEGIHLGGAGAFRDSGMVGTASAHNPRAFVNSGHRAVDALVEIFAQRRPHLVLTYGPDGGYGHPDHIRAHEITHAAAEQVSIPRILWAVNRGEDLTEAMAQVRGIPEGWRSAEEELATVEHADAWVELDDELYHLKKEAMRAHATQLWLADGDYSATNPHSAWAQVDADLTIFALSNLIAQPIMRRESYQVGAGSAPTSPTELLSGISLADTSTNA